MLICLFGGRRKVHVTKLAFEDFVYVVFCYEFGRHIAWLMKFIARLFEEKVKVRVWLNYKLGNFVSETFVPHMFPC